MKTIFILLFCSFGILSVHAQRGPGALEFDAIGFARDSGKIQVELYYSVLQQSLHFKEMGGKWVAPIRAKFQVIQDDKVIAEKDVQKQISFTGTKEDLSKNVNISLDAMFFSVSFSKNTKAVLIFTGENKKGENSSDTIVRSPMYLPVLKQDSFLFSGIEFASNLAESADKNNIFEKVGYIVTPNPSRIFGGEYNTLYYYTELYTPISKINANDSLSVTMRILDANQLQIVKKNQMMPITSKILPVLSSFEIDGLPTDSYSLEVSAQYGGTTVARIIKSFYYENSMKITEEETSGQEKKVLDEELLYQSSDINKMADLELNEKIEQANYAVNDETRKSFKKITLSEEKKKAFFSFWRKQDEPGAMPLSSYRRYFQRVEEANKKFSYQKTPGWKSDRGRVYVTYGPPNFTNAELFNTEAKPYITWEYASLNMRVTSGSKAQFVFLDRLGGGNFYLVHSNVIGEVQEPDWYSREAHRLR